ncbi:MAG: AAA family ATPase [Selenomonadaceae bacterium]|nr:AAA family ATPase [Selenomonadaceae bacterium]
MRISKISVKNYKCFDDAEVQLNDKYTVLVGINGAGKTALLECIKVFLNGLLYTMRCNTQIYTLNRNAKIKKMMYEGTSSIERQYPVEVKVSASIQGYDEFDYITEAYNEHFEESSSSSEHVIDFIRNIPYALVSEGNNIVLPIMAVYGTGRLWKHVQDKDKFEIGEPVSRLTGYDRCLEADSDEERLVTWFKRMTMIEWQEKKTPIELEIVKNAMAECYKSILHDNQEVIVQYDVRDGELHIVIRYANGMSEKVPFTKMSDGIRIAMAMVADIAHRMVTLNPQLGKGALSETNGIVLIDEIDMHLHPSWQKHIIADLCKIFPQVQFVFTTHSPIVLSNVKNDNIVALSSGKVYKVNQKTYGRAADSIMKEIMGTDVRPEDVSALQDKFNTALDRGEIEKAKIILADLIEHLGADDELIMNNQASIDFEEL